MLGGKSVNTETETEPIGNLPISGGNYQTDANPSPRYVIPDRHKAKGKTNHFFF